MSSLVHSGSGPFHDESRFDPTTPTSLNRSNPAFTSLRQTGSSSIFEQQEGGRKMIASCRKVMTSRRGASIVEAALLAPFLGVLAMGVTDLVQAGALKVR